MVDLATTLLGKTAEMEAIAETRHGLPDAIQLLAPCTVGNGRLKILDMDKFAMTLYDRKTLAGVRVWLDPKKVAKFQDITNWFLRKANSKGQPMDALINNIFRADKGVLSSAPVMITRYSLPTKKRAVKICTICQEAYAGSHGNTCLSCQGHGYYDYELYEAPN